MGSVGLFAAAAAGLVAIYLNLSVYLFCLAFGDFSFEAATRGIGPWGLGHLALAVLCAGLARLLDRFAGTTDGKDIAVAINTLAAVVGSAAFLITLVTRALS